MKLWMTWVPIFFTARNFCNSKIWNYIVRHTNELVIYLQQFLSHINLIFVSEVMKGAAGSANKLWFQSHLLATTTKDNVIQIVGVLLRIFKTVGDLEYIFLRL